MPLPPITSTAVERFLRYVTYDTQSDESSTTSPTTPGQLDLQRLLVSELHALGCVDAELDSHGYVMATIPATSQKPNIPTIGFVAHVDTSPEMSGKGVKPLVHKNYRGTDIVLPDDPTQVIRFADNPALAEQIGHDIITASGKTLLGADNKAGVAEIMGAAEYLMRHKSDVPHGTIRICFTPDEEVGRGTNHFDVQKFGATFAYTMDGETRGALEGETFSADAMTITFQGFNTHPGFAKGRMINAIKIAADFIQRLPKDRLSPETTDGDEGFVHPYVVNAAVDRTAVKFLIRDFRTTGLKEKEAFLEKLARETVASYPRATLEVKVEESYRNMREILDQHPECLNAAKEAIKRAGLPLRLHKVRGGTDGSRLSFMGLPTPNIFAGEHNFHSRLEWVSAQDIEKAVEVIVHLCCVWEERST